MDVGIYAWVAIAAALVAVFILFLLRGRWRADEKKLTGEGSGSTALGAAKSEELPPEIPVSPTREESFHKDVESAVQTPAPISVVPTLREAISMLPDSAGVHLNEEAEGTAQAKLEEGRREKRASRLRKGLEPTRGGLIKKIANLFAGKKELDAKLLIDLEEALITADVGAKTTEWLISVLKDALSKDELADPAAVWSLLQEEVRQILTVEAPPLDFKTAKPYVILVVGVNGVGKTTTIGKLAAQLIDEGHQVVLAAADTFRAAAVNQLEIWGQRAGAEVVRSKEGSDPSSVVFDAVTRAKEIGADVVIADTAGRIHTKASLMEEVKKIARVIGKATDGGPHQILMVLDATTGQNAVSQVAMFKEALDLTGLVVTKLDGTAKGGVIIGICYEHKLPIRYIGIGEAKDDLRLFNADEFSAVLFSADR